MAHQYLFDNEGSEEEEEKKAWALLSEQLETHGLGLQTMQVSFQPIMKGEIF